MHAGVRPATMRAVQYNGYGGGATGLKFVEVPVTSVNKNEVLIKVEAGSINQFDFCNPPNLIDMQLEAFADSLT
uniref:Uncharacterized protein n=1 Tax=Leersia perrieri TaxID=77586 RepID=A0A0D9W3U3_9ORYZ